MHLSTIHYIVAIASSILTPILTIGFILVIKFNDMKHLNKKVDRLISIVDDLVSRVSKIEGKLEIK